MTSGPPPPASAFVGFPYELSAADPGLATLPAGAYRVQLLVGPDLTPLSEPADLTVGTARQHAAKPGAPSPISSPHHQPAPGTDVHQTPGGSTT